MILCNTLITNYKSNSLPCELLKAFQKLFSLHYKTFWKPPVKDRFSFFEDDFGILFFLSFETKLTKNRFFCSLCYLWSAMHILRLLLTQFIDSERDLSCSKSQNWKSNGSFCRVAHCQQDGEGEFLCVHRLSSLWASHCISFQLGHTRKIYMLE